MKLLGIFGHYLLSRPLFVLLHQLQITVTVIRASGVYAMLNRYNLTKFSTDLISALTGLHVHNYTHFDHYLLSRPIFVLLHQLQITVTVIRASGVYAMLNRYNLTKFSTDLISALTGLHVHNYTHFEFLGMLRLTLRQIRIKHHLMREISFRSSPGSPSSAFQYRLSYRPPGYADVEENGKLKSTFWRQIKTSLCNPRAF
uniref:Uncharacterized protein n=1 Tax=Glossina palpalis gambiensis TaxID=67801 RepID=A0A1B0BL24_9MUSC